MCASQGRRRGPRPGQFLRNEAIGRTFVDLMHPRVDGLFALAQRILRDVDRAEDALQDALVIAWRDLRGLRDPDRFDAWLRRVVVRECIDQATRERRRVANLPGVACRRAGRAG